VFNSLVENRRLAFRLVAVQAAVAVLVDAVTRARMLQGALLA